MSSDIDKIKYWITYYVIGLFHLYITSNLSNNVSEYTESREASAQILIHLYFFAAFAANREKIVAQASSYLRPKKSIAPIVQNFYKM